MDLHLDPSSGLPAYRQLAAALAGEIRAGRLAVGARLPSERDMAESLKLSRTTVTAAFRELESQGLVRGHVGRGTVVLAQDLAASPDGLPWRQRASRLATPPDTRGPRPAEGADLIAFADGWLHPELHPRAQIAEALAAAQQDMSGLLAPAPILGLPILREGLARMLGARGVEVRPDEILVTGGAQQGLNVVARALISPGDAVLVESPTWHGAIRAFRAAGAEAAGVPMDREGVDPDALEDALIRLRPKLVYLIPSFHCPTGRVMGLERRRQVLALCAKFRTPVLESDVYGDIAIDGPRPPSLKSLDTAGLVIHQGSASKTVGSSLRIGWLAAPPGAMELLAAAKANLDLSSPTLPQAVLAEFLQAGALSGHLARFTAALRRRRDAMAQALARDCPALTFQAPEGGLYIWARLPPQASAADLQARAAALGLSIRAGDVFFPEGGQDRHIRLCFAAPHADRIAEGVARLGRALDEAMGAGGPAASGAGYAAV
jgi:DNA-binding transcriptional MocR family regulator